MNFVMNFCGNIILKNHYAQLVNKNILALANIDSNRYN